MLGLKLIHVSEMVRILIIYIIDNKVSVDGVTQRASVDCMQYSDPRM